MLPLSPPATAAQVVFQLAGAQNSFLDAEISSDLALFLDWLACVGIEAPFVGWVVGKL